MYYDLGLVRRRRTISLDNSYFVVPGGAAAVTFNPADKSSSIALTGGNLTATSTSTGFRTVRVTGAGHLTGKYYAQFIKTAVNNFVFGIANSTENLDSYIGSSLNSIGWVMDSRILCNAANPIIIQGLLDAVVASAAIDLDNRKLWFKPGSGNWNNDGAADPATNVGGIPFSDGTNNLNAGPYFMAITVSNVDDTVTLNAGGSSYSLPAPTGFVNW